MAEKFELPEKPSRKEERTVGLIIAAIAVILAVVSAYSHDIQNEEIVHHVDASDQYAYYQAKRDRDTLYHLQIDQLTLQADRFTSTEKTEADKLITDYQDQAAKLDQDETGIRKKADELTAEAEEEARKANVLDLGEIGLQVSIVLCSITVLTELSLFLRMGVVLAVLGTLVAIYGFFFV